MGAASVSMRRLWAAREARSAWRVARSTGRLVSLTGEARCDRQGKGTSVRPGSRSGAKTRDGSPGDLRDPIGVYVSEPELRVAGIQDPGKGRDMHPANLVHDTTWIAKLTR